ncbi:helix-turn-helix domain-containing protein [Sediminicola luteus]|uniref:HTH araC/xylS-type domain-containing protein n=1 Tax=Sediminicola luteus TaxID=319238 RepID=A0A2A4GA03_9FLAO|nr:AraC family transcriptional regulator [Sediminicola luteus]PCE65779.1 hypothetical protein B7P33_00285 [Sediminicola luteus]
MDVSIKVLSLVFIFLSLLFTFFLFTVPTKKRLSNVLIACFLIVTIIDLSVYLYQDYVTLPPYLEMLRIRISFLKSPLLFLYILSVFYADFRLRIKHLIHLVPFLMVIGVLLPRFFLADKAQQLEFFDDYHNRLEIIFIGFLGNILMVTYMAANIYYAVNYRRIIVQNYANASALSNFRWIVQLLSVIILLAIITTVKDALRFNPDANDADLARLVMLGGGILFISWVVLKALYSPRLFTGIESNIKSVSISTHANPKDSATIERIRAFIEKEEPYLDASLTIKSLADQLNMPVRDLSTLINNDLETHFFDFINEFRIRKAMRLLKNDSQGSLSIKEIMFDVGFNSKSPFNKAFKKYAEQTPSEYRQSTGN